MKSGEFHIAYRADGEDGYCGQWKPSIHMPRWASRTTLEIVNVRVERVQKITEADAIAEGLDAKYYSIDDLAGIDTDLAEILRLGGGGYMTVKHEFRKLWHSLYAKSFPWASNPWVWVYEFKKVTA